MGRFFKNIIVFHYITLMKIFYTLLLLSMSFSFWAQNSVISFDGIDDYVDLGTDAGDSIRTIELWFKLDNPVDDQLSDFMGLVVRENNSFTNEGNFNLSFQHSGVANPGTLRMSMGGLAPYEEVFSNNNSWNANQWYHVAAVIDSVQGMMMFIDGVKQNSTHPYTGATTVESSITTIGGWGTLNDRYFEGKVDDVKFSKKAKYTTNFTPSCGNGSNQNQYGVWNFNTASSVVAIDSSVNGFHGVINGAVKLNEDVCVTVIPPTSNNNVISFDGADDYVDLGTDAGDSIRTIELWFKLDNPVDDQLSDFMGLVVRENNSFTNEGNFNLSFQHSGVANPGTLRMSMGGLAPYEEVFSNNNSWNANQWYHVAAVIDSVQGMMMFIDGVKQNSTHPYTGATTVESSITTIGGWGTLNDRYFEGKVDDVKFSKKAKYTTNFTPSCGNGSNQNQYGVWNFNTASSVVAIDSSLNGFHGVINGAVKLNEDVCQSASLIEHKPADIILVYPNPSNTGVFKFSNVTDYRSKVFVYDVSGNIVYDQTLSNPSFDLDLSTNSKGVYFYQIISDQQFISTGKLIIN